MQGDARAANDARAIDGPTRTIDAAGDDGPTPCALCDARPPDNDGFVLSAVSLVADVTNDGADDLILFGQRGKVPQLRIFAGEKDSLGTLFTGGAEQVLATEGALVVAADGPRSIAGSGAFVGLGRRLDDGTTVAQVFALINGNALLAQSLPVDLSLADTKSEAFIRLLQARGSGFAIAGAPGTAPVILALNDGGPHLNDDSPLLDVVAAPSATDGTDDFVGVLASEVTWYPYQSVDNAYEHSDSFETVERPGIIRFGDIDSSGTRDVMMSSSLGKLDFVRGFAPSQPDSPGGLQRLSGPQALGGTALDFALVDIDGTNNNDAPDLVMLIQVDSGSRLRLYSELSIAGDTVTFGSVTETEIGSALYGTLVAGDFSGDGADEIYVLAGALGGGAAPPQCFVAGDAGLAHCR